MERGRIEAVRTSAPRDRTPTQPQSQPSMPERVEAEPSLARANAQPVVVPAAPVAAAPIVRHTAETHVRRIHSIATTTADEPPVRVHIGRLEVRANLEQPAPTPARREAKREEGVSLSDYLRGRQTA